MMLQNLIGGFYTGIFKASLLSISLTAIPVSAQILPDNTLPQNSVVIPQGNIRQIDGGTRSGNTLFHSFEQFSVPTGETAFFNNAVEIENIFSRVTGSSISEINGILKANGFANLFLINPNGIIFGENASLNIGGSFFATSADRVIFANETEFRATNPNSPPLLTINIPIGLRFRENPGSIVVRSRSTFITSDEMGQQITTTGLQVPSEQTLMLLGGDIRLEGGILTAPGGKIELGSVAGNSLINLDSDSEGFALNYNDVQSFQDIRLFNLAEINTSGEGGGTVKIQGRQVNLTGDSTIISSTLGSGIGGDIFIAASDSVTITEQGSGLFAEVRPNATGQGGTITVDTRRLTVTDGAQISATTSGLGQAGNLAINATESINLVGEAPNRQGPSGLFARVEAGATGDGGNIVLKTRRLTLQDGAQVSTDTFGRGDAGDLFVDASDGIEIVGSTAEGEGRFASGLYAQVAEGGRGNGGNLTINTSQLMIREGAQMGTTARNTGQAGILTINASDFVILSGTAPVLEPQEDQRSGIFVSAEPAFKDESGNLIITTADAGELTINTPELIVENGARISADNFGTGGGSDVNLNVERLMIRDGGQIGAGSLVENNAISNERGPGGTLTVNAAESVEITGTDTIGSTVENSRLFTLAEGTGNAGDLNISTPSLTVSDAAEVTVSATGSGEAGSLTINAENIRLNHASLKAETQQGTEGNITINSSDILLRQGSAITTNSLNTGTGGNIEINTNLLTAIENSDISANAQAGPGGRVTVNADAIFGTQFRLQQTNVSDITATSELGPEFSGTVELNTELDPTSGLIELSQTVVDPNDLINQEFCKQRGTSEFVIKGRQGLPLDPNDTLTPEGIDVDLVEPVPSNPPTPSKPRSNRLETEDNHHSISSLDLIPARGWIRNENGDVILVSYDPTQTGVIRPSHPPLQCHSHIKE